MQVEHSSIHRINKYIFKKSKGIDVIAMIWAKKNNFISVAWTRSENLLKICCSRFKTGRLSPGQRFLFRRPCAHALSYTPQPVCTLTDVGVT